MSDFEREDGTSREELMQRVALMEAMIAEGRRSTGRFGWIFILWGVVCLTGTGWSALQPRASWAWLVVIACGFLIQYLGISMQRSSGRWASGTTKSRSITAVWRMMSLAILLYVIPAALRGDAGQISNVAAIFMFLGMAHAISAAILRWRAQAAVAGLWWAGGVATYFVPRDSVVAIYVVEMVFGMILFGLYAMMLERRAAGLVQHHA